MKRIMLLTLFFCLMLGLGGHGRVQASPPTLPALAILHVAPGGSDNPGCGSQASPCGSVHYAVDLAGSGDTVKVAAGAYTRAQSCSQGAQTAMICTYNKHLTLLGGYTTGNWSVADPAANVTILDGQNVHRVLVAQAITSSDGSLHMEGFTVQNGRAQGAGSGDDNVTFAFGGGILVDRAPLTMRHMIFKDNRAIGGNTSNAYGGAGSGGGMAVRAIPVVVLEDLVFEGNEARGGSGVERGGFAIGGGLYTYQSSVTGGHLTFFDNQSVGGSANGSGLAGGNRADAQGAGVAWQIGSVVEVHHLVAYNNQATGGNAPNGDAGGAFGGGVFAEVSQLTLTDSNIYDNLALGGNGRNDGPSGSLGVGGGLNTGTAEITLDRVRIVNNTARGGNGVVNTGAGGGGGYYISGYSDVFINNSIFADNVAEMGTTGAPTGGGGGGLFVNFADVVITHSTFARNQLGGAPMQGNGIVVLNGGQADINYSIIAGHTVLAGAAAVHAQPGNTVNLNTNLFSGNTIDTGGGGTINGGGTSFSGPPAFVSPGAPNYDYHINSNSAAVGQAAGSVTPVDFDAEARDGQPDVGADEYVPLVPDIVAVGGAPQASGTVLAYWRVVNMQDLDHYEITITCPGGASPPDQAACGASLSVGTALQFQLTGLTNFATYGLTVEAFAAGNELLASNSGTFTPTNILAYLPFGGR